MCEKHYRRQWRVVNREQNKAYESSYYQNITKPIKQLNNKPKEKICLRCGKLFTRTGANQKFCSKTCQNNITHKRKRQNPEFKLIHNIRSRLRKALKRQSRDKGIYILLGCSSNDLRLYLEYKFKIGMTWNNYGKEWHIDHIRPLFGFDLLNKDQLKDACHYSNLQPLWIEDHLVKSIMELK